MILQGSQLTAVDLVRSIPAVHASVTPPAAVDALPISTLKIVDTAAHHLLVRLPILAGLRPLVGPIGTVLVPVAAPQGRHTHRVVALEGPRAARGFGAGSLV